MIYSFDSQLLILLQKSTKPSIFERYAEIFSDPFFMLLAVLLIGLFYFVYTIFGMRNHGVSESPPQLAAQLAYYGLRYLDSTEQSDSGPFERLAPVPKSVFEEPKKQYFSYHTVQAQANDGQKYDFWAEIEYQNNAPSAISWLPDISTIQGDQKAN